MSTTLYKQALLNVIWAHHFLPEDEFQSIADKLAQGNQLPLTPINITVDEINPTIVPLGFEIKRGVSEGDGTAYFGICNNRGDQMSQLATHFKPAELRYFNSLVKAIMGSKPIGTTDRPTALNARLDDDQTKSISAAAAEELIKKFASEKWLSLSGSKDETIALGPRSILELRQYIEGEWADSISECTICSEIVFKGETCTNAVCTIKMHHHCARRWYHGKAERKCPHCSLPWPAAPKGWEDNEPLPPPRAFHPNAVLVD